MPIGKLAATNFQKLAGKRLTANIIGTDVAPSAETPDRNPGTVNRDDKAALPEVDGQVEELLWEDAAVSDGGKGLLMIRNWIIPRHTSWFFFPDIDIMLASGASW